MPARRRRPDVLWRLGNDRVVARRIGGDGVDLMGLSAMVWVALDEPREVNHLVAEFSGLVKDADGPTIETVLAQLEEAGLVEHDT